MKPMLWMRDGDWYCGLKLGTYWAIPVWCATTPREAYDAWNSRIHA